MPEKMFSDLIMRPLSFVRMAVTKMIEKGLGSNPTAKPKKMFSLLF